ETSLHYEVIYGLTENLSLTAEVPHVVEKREGDNITDGLGEVALRAKYQVFRKDTLGAQDKVALIYGMKFPTGSEDRNPALGSGALDHLFGLSLGHESTTWYGFATGRYVLRPEAGTREQGDRVLVDVAVGVGVLVDVAVGVGVLVAVAVGVGVLVDVDVAVGVAVGVSKS
ncbi:MAG: transporter, partial [Chloroflexi bacterium]|nr:transporter [Chloroflexota bacterium]